MAVNVPNQVRAQFNDQPPPQTDIRQVPSNPSSNMPGRPGLIVVDAIGKVYVKQSEENLLTGWAEAAVT